MKKTVISLSAMLLLAALLPSCGKLGRTGKPVVFSATAHGEPGTRTQYAGGLSGTDDHEAIYWSSGDQILIQSSDASVASTPSSERSALYTLSVQSDNASLATITNTAENGLSWNESSAVTFYGAYPGDIAERTAAGEFSMSVDKDQTYADLIDPSVETDMSKAYMLARADAAAGATSVKLDFYPAFTAFEIHLANRTPAGNLGTGDITLTSLSLKSTTDDLSGDYFSSGWTGGAPTGFTQVGTGDKEVTVTFPAGTTISDTKEVAFTIFVLPVKDVTNLSLELTFVNSAGTTLTKNLKLKKNDEFIRFDACKKHRLTGVTLDSGDTWNLYMTLDVIPQQLDREDNILVDDTYENKLTDLTVLNYEDADFTTGEIVLNYNRGIFYFFTELGRWTRWQASLIGTPGVFSFCEEDGTVLLDAAGNPRITYGGNINGETQYFYIKALNNSPSGRAILRITAYDSKGNSKIVYDMVNFNDFSEYTIIKNS